MPLGKKKTKAFDIYKTENLSFEGSEQIAKSKMKSKKMKKMSGSDSIFSIGSKAK